MAIRKQQKRPCGDGNVNVFTVPAQYTGCDAVL